MIARLRTQRVMLAMACLLLIGLGLRLYNLNWDDGHHVHPDERWITMVAMDTWAPDDLSDVFNPRRSALNPYWNVRDNQPRRFAYGSFPLYLVRASATAISGFATATGLMPEWRRANDYDHLNLLGRFLSAISDTLTIGLIFLLGRRVYGVKVGLLAAALLTFTVQHIQLAHFYAFDVVTATVVVAALYFGARVVQEGRLSDSLWLGAMTALAIASKFSAVPLLAVVVLAHTLRPVLRWQTVHGPRPASALGIVANPPLVLSGEMSSEVSRATLGLMLSLLSVVVVFAIASPFSLLDFNGYVASLSEQSDMVRGVADFPYT
ncbi:MAG: glycosyltransferase family 39 protein, partial [Chloroflexi bacterium]|nr:glycosyltransferase family 39 protein [Chloroflexota bacterium]